MGIPLSAAREGLLGDDGTHGAAPNEITILLLPFPFLGEATKTSVTITQFVMIA